MNCYMYVPDGGIDRVRCAHGQIAGGIPRRAIRKTIGTTIRASNSMTPMPRVEDEQDVRTAM